MTMKLYELHEIVTSGRLGHPSVQWAAAYTHEEAVGMLVDQYN
jgi:hypothetical protein